MQMDFFIFYFTTKYGMIGIKFGISNRSHILYMQETNYVPITRGSRVVLMVNGYVRSVILSDGNIN